MFLLSSDFSRHFLKALLGTCGTRVLALYTIQGILSCSLDITAKTWLAQYILGVRLSRIPSKDISERLNLQWRKKHSPMLLASKIDGGFFG
jgi:hypothetical protein